MSGLNLIIRPVTAADCHPPMPNLVGYWGIFEGGRVAAVSRDPAELEKILEDVHGIKPKQARVAA